MLGTRYFNAVYFISIRICGKYIRKRVCIDLCTSHSQCSQYGECTYNRAELRYSCKCREGFEGDGVDCRPSGDAGCDTLRNCDQNGRCVWNAGRSKYLCECNAGWIGDGLRCQEDMTGCNILNNCARNGECSYDSQARGYRCHCKQARQLKISLSCI
jgi:nidogen (entactin)